CRVIAWRVTPVPALKRVIESGPSAERRCRRPSRVGSARAANTGTASRSLSAVLLRLDIARELPGLGRPPLARPAERLGPTAGGDPIKPGLDERESGADPLR